MARMKTRFAQRSRLASVRRRLITTSVGIALGLLTGACGDDERARVTEQVPELPFVVGPSPLRRLSNSEYANALADLFPSVHVDTPGLPNDTVVAGFENAAEAQKPSDVRVARYETIANLYAREATLDSQRTRALLGCTWESPSKAEACATAFVETWGEKTFRRPLTSGERDRLSVNFQRWRASIDFEGAVRLTLATMLQAPQFLYRAEPEPEGAAPGTIVPLDGYAMASRLSFFLWESTPDEALLEAARKNELSTATQVRAQATRMLASPRARRTYWSFHRQWLGLGRILEEEHAARTAEVDPAWTSATALSAQQESRLFVENVLADGGSFGDLMTSRRAWVDGEMARIYGLQAPSGAGFVEATLPLGERAGIPTRAAFLAATSHRGSTSPPIRGNAIQLRMLCQAATPPPPDADLSVPAPKPGDEPKTTRGLFELRTSPPSCQTCHASLNGFGFGFESYSASGAHRKSEHGLPVDTRGSILYTDVDGEYEGPVALVGKLAKSRAVKRCATLQWMRYAMGRAPADDEIAVADALTDRFVAGDDVRALLVDVVTTNSFRMRRIRGTK